MFPAWGAHFRRSSWGMNMDAIIEYEGQPKLLTRTTLHYDGIVAGLKAEVEYRFNPQGFFKGTYILSDRLPERRQYIDEFMQLEELLILKYGKPVEQREMWFNDEFKQDLGYRLDALLLGHVSYWSTWLLESSIVQLKLFRYGNGVNFTLEYTPSSGRKNAENPLLTL